MTDPRGREPLELARQRQHLDEFLADATRDVERMRALVVQLEAGDPTAWARVQNTAHNLGARSRTLKLDVMSACARELEQLTDERQDGAALDGFFLQCVTSAIETLALEIAALRRA
jgi:hypothetical protein